MTPNHTLNDILVWVILVWNEFLSWLPTGIVSGGLTRLPANMSAAIAGTDIWTKPTWNPKEMVLEEDRMAEICWNFGRNIRTCHFFFAYCRYPCQKVGSTSCCWVGVTFFQQGAQVAHLRSTWSGWDATFWSAKWSLSLPWWRTAAQKPCSSQRNNLLGSPFLLLHVC